MSGERVCKLCVVQFPHPGSERPSKNWQIGYMVPWNDGPRHRRKFLEVNGRYLGQPESPQSGRLVFWGEWEPPSRIIEKWEPKDSLPRFLHRPVWRRQQPKRAQNTDPWLFGKCFRYSNCKQVTPNGNRSAMQFLAPGSLIVFGSTVGDDFVADTVFVVKDGQRFSLNDPPGGDEAFRTCTLESLRTCGSAHAPLTSYQSAGYDTPIDGMYSFVPCRRADADHIRFQRPTIPPSRYVNPRSKQSPRLTEVRSHAELRELWETLRERVLDAGCLLGVSFSTPQLDKGISRRENSKLRR